MIVLFYIVSPLHPPAVSAVMFKLALISVSLGNSSQLLVPNLMTRQDNKFRIYIVRPSVCPSIKGLFIQDSSFHLSAFII